MARAGLGSAWTCLFANDFDSMKADVYDQNWGRGQIACGDVANILGLGLGLVSLPGSVPSRELQGARP